MKILRHVLVLGAVVCCWLSLSLVKANGQLPRPTSYLFVEVKDTEGKHITDATITVSDPSGKEIATNIWRDDRDQIHIRFPLRSDHHYNVLITKPGYLPSEHVFFSGPGRERLLENFPDGNNSQPVFVVMRKPPITESEDRALEVEEKKNRLLLAIKRGDSATVVRLLHEGVSAKTADADGVPAIAWAAFSGDAETIRASLAAGANVRSRNSFASKALLIYLANGLPRKERSGQSENQESDKALIEHQETAVLVLIRAGADVNAKDAERGTVLNAALDQVPNHLTTRVIKQLIAAGANINTADESRRSTPLMWAASSGSLDAVQMLIRAGAIIDAKDKEGKTALMWTQIGSEYPGYNPAIVKTLITAGADVNVVDTYGQTPLTMAAGADLFESVKLLLAAGANVSAKDRGESALIRAFQSHYSSKDDSTIHPSVVTVQALIAAGANVHDVNRDGQTLVMLAARRNSLEALKILIAAGVDVNAKDNNGQTALMYDQVWGYRPNVETFKVLLATGGEVNAVDKNGQTALMFAAKGAPAPIINLLLAAGAKTSINARNKYGQTALMIACYESNFYFNSEDQLRTVKLLLAAGADLTIKDNGGRTALMIAQSGRNEALIKLLETLTKP